jgi:hypothetical protein
MYNTVFIIYLEYAKDFHLYLFFCTAWFLLVKNTRKILSRKISYNRNPVTPTRKLNGKTRVHTGLLLGRVKASKYNKSLSFGLLSTAADSSACSSSPVYLNLDIFNPVRFWLLSSKSVCCTYNI